MLKLAIVVLPFIFRSVNTKKIYYEYLRNFLLSFICSFSFSFFLMLNYAHNINLCKFIFKRHVEILILKVFLQNSGENLHIQLSF